MVFKKIILILIIIFTYTQTLSADHIPEVSSFINQYQGRFSIIRSINHWNPYLEVLGNINTNFSPSYYHFLTGSYYRVHKNLKIGAFYKLQGGVTHDDDWLFLNPGWEWDDSINRVEHNLILDLSPRFIIPKILNKKAVASLKIRYQYNFFNEHQTLLFKPGVSFFYMFDRKPVWNASLAYSMYFPLNFSEAFIYEHGPYLNFIYHMSDLIKVETRASFHIKTWTSGKDSIALGDSYNVNEKGLNIGIGIILTP
jgi:hypothetical protein